MFIDNGGHSTASGVAVMAGVGGGAGDGSVNVSALVPRLLGLAQEPEGASGRLNKQSDEQQRATEGRPFCLLVQDDWI
jgi:hypothetical protein